MERQTIFIDGYPPFEVERPRSWPSLWNIPGAYGFAVSHALICPRCLKQWGILHFRGDADIFPQPARCEAHGGGTIFHEWRLDPELLRVLPEPLLRREFELTMRQFQL